MGTPTQAEGDLLKDVPLRVVHLDVADLQLRAGCGLTDAVEASGELTSRFHLDGGARRLLEEQADGVVLDRLELSEQSQLVVQHLDQAEIDLCIQLIDNIPCTRKVIIRIGGPTDHC